MGTHSHAQQGREYYDHTSYESFADTAASTMGLAVGQSVSEMTIWAGEMAEAKINHGRSGLKRTYPPSWVLKSRTENWIRDRDIAAEEK